MNFILKTLKSEHFRKCNKEAFALYLVIIQEEKTNFSEKELSEKTGISEMSILRHLLYLQTLGWIKFQKSGDFQILLGNPNFLSVLLEKPEQPSISKILNIKPKVTEKDILYLFKNRYFQTYGQMYPVNIKKEMAHIHTLLNYAEKDIQLLLDIINFIFDNHEKIAKYTWIKNKITLQSLTVTNIWTTINEVKAEGFKEEVNIKNRFQESPETKEIGWK